MGFGCGLLHVHSSADTGFIFYGLIARYPGDQIFGHPRSSTFNRSPALGFAILPGDCGGGRS